MLTRDDVRIASPCGVDFSKMTRKDATRRFCGECRTVVHDLSRMTEAAARALLDAPAAQGLCVRYLADDAGRLHFAPDVPSGLLARAKRAAVGAALAAAPLSLTACMGARMAEPPVAAPARPAAPDTIVATKGTTEVVVLRGPGVMVDTSAQAEAPKESAWAHGTCAGEALGCSEARGLLSVSSSYEDYLEKLRAVGFSLGPS